MSLLFQLQGQHGYLPTTRQQIMCAFTWNQALEAVHLNSPLLSSHSEINTPPLPWQLRAEKKLFLGNSVYTNNVLNAQVHV